ncbi:MAG: helix-turn-helix domain-containing protein [Nocardioides sp.]|uniref:helix-turn-helix domain-containing protein n=1 Tax=Nocardioides sp. TaxID=35761 RepID=UPI003F108DE3
MEQRGAALEVADRVIRQLMLAGDSVHHLCFLTGIPRVTMDRRLSGETPFTLNEIDRIAEALRVPTAHLLPPA